MASLMIYIAAAYILIGVANYIRVVLIVTLAISGFYFGFDESIVETKNSLDSINAACEMLLKIVPRPVALFLLALVVLLCSIPKILTWPSSLINVIK